MTWKKMIISLKIMKKVRETYSRDGNEHLRDEMNLLLVSLKIIKRV